MIVKLTQGRETVIDDEDAALIEGWSWQAVQRGKGGKALWYARGYRAGKWKYMHRLLMPEAKIVDHIDHDGLNNRRSNLRACSQSANLRNTGLQCNNTSGYRGVSFHKRWGWHAFVKHMGRPIHLGWFKTPEEAAWARDAWVVKNADRHAFLNLPPVLNPLLAKP